MIIVEKVDFAKLTTEKVSFVVDEQDDIAVYNVSEGTYHRHSDDLYQSPLYCPLPTEIFRQMLWDEIQQYLPEYLETRKKTTKYGRLLGRYFHCLISAALRSKEVDIKLLYMSNRDQAEMLGRCIKYLASQI